MFKYKSFFFLFKFTQNLAVLNLSKYPPFKEV